MHALHVWSIPTIRAVQPCENNMHQNPGSEPTDEEMSVLDRFYCRSVDVVFNNSAVAFVFHSSHTDFTSLLHGSSARMVGIDKKTCFVRISFLATGTTSLTHNLIIIIGWLVGNPRLIKPCAFVYVRLVRTTSFVPDHQAFAYWHTSDIPCTSRSSSYLQIAQHAARSFKGELIGWPWLLK